MKGQLSRKIIQEEVGILENINHQRNRNLSENYPLDRAPGSVTGIT